MQSRFSSLTAALLLAGLFTPVLADTDTDAGRIVVTATRFPTTAADQPVNMTVITRRDIERSPASNVSDLLRGVSGIIVRNNSSSDNGAIDLRGFGISGASNTLILLDGVKLNDNDLSSPQLSTLALGRVERIEIVRGGTVAWGGGSTGGVINVITRRDNGTDAQLRVGSHASYEGLIGTGMQQGDFYLRADGRYYDSHGFRSNSNEKARAASAELAWQAQQTRVALSIAKDSEDLRLAGVRRVNPVTGLNEFRDDPWGTNTPNDWGNTDAERVSLHGEGQFDTIRWAADASHRSKKTEAFFDYGFGYTAADRRDGQENRLSPRVSLKLGDVELASGIDVARAHTDRYSGSVSANAYAGDSQLNTQALWFDLGLPLQPGTRVTFGARHETAKQTANAAASDWAPAVHNERKDSPNAVQLGLRQQLSPGLSLFARAGTSYRLANADELVGNPNLRAQTSRDLEVGADVRIGTGKLRFSAFNLRLKNEIAFQPYENFGQNINLAPTRRQGVELEGSQKLGDLDLNANLTWLDATFRSGIYGGKDVGGKQVPLVPKLQGNLQLGWAWSDATRLDGLLHLASHSRLDNDQENTGPELAGYATLDLKLSHKIGAWKLALSGENLTDQRYATYGVKSTFGPNYNLYPMQGRRWSASAAYHF